MQTAPALIVLVAEDSGEAARLGGLLGALNCRVLALTDWQIAEARIAGGGVDLVVFSLFKKDGSDRLWNMVTSIRRRCTDLPILVVDDFASGERGAVAGFSTPPVLRVLEAELLASAQVLMAPRRNPPEPVSQDRGGTLAVQGAKGGVGASTVALNLAALLARHGSTILIEMRPGLGTLASHFHIRRQVRTVADLAGHAPIGPADVEQCLWHCHQVPGLSILFGPPSLEIAADWPARTREILKAARKVADHVVVDLPGGFCAINRAALSASDCMLLVLERDALCLRAGKLMLAALEAENLLPNATQAVVVNRVALSAPVGLQEIEGELQMSLAAILPPAPDLCLQAYQAQTAVVLLDPESMLAAGYEHLVESLPSIVRGRSLVPA